MLSFASSFCRLDGIATLGDDFNYEDYTVLPEETRKNRPLLSIFLPTGFALN